MGKYLAPVVPHSANYRKELEMKHQWELNEIVYVNFAPDRKHLASISNRLIVNGKLLTLTVETLDGAQYIVVPRMLSSVVQEQSWT